MPLLERDIESFLLEESKRFHPTLQQSQRENEDSKNIQKPTISGVCLSYGSTGELHTSPSPAKFSFTDSSSNQTPSTTTTGGGRVAGRGWDSGSATPQTGERLGLLSNSMMCEGYDDEEPIPRRSAKTQTRNEHNTPLQVAAGGSVESPLSFPSPNSQSVPGAKNSGSNDITTLPSPTSTSTTSAKNSSNDIATKHTNTKNRKVERNGNKFFPSTIQSNVAAPKLSLLSTKNLTNQATQFIINIDENEECPLINNRHPVVNRGTLALINSGAAVSNTRPNAVTMTTPNFVTYVVAPSPMATWLMSDVCTPTSSGLTGTRMINKLASFYNTVKSLYNGHIRPCKTGPYNEVASLLR